MPTMRSGSASSALLSGARYERRKGMGRRKMISINNEDIESIRLLSKKEAEALPKWIRANGTWWWLRSPGGDSTHVAIVRDDGSVNSYGFNVCLSFQAVRPALKIRNLDSLNFKVGETIEVLGLFAQYIGHNSVLLCESIARRRFDANSNDYKASEIKRSVVTWLVEKKGEQE